MPVHLVNTRAPTARTNIIWRVLVVCERRRREQKFWTMFFFAHINTIFYIKKMKIQKKIFCFCQKKGLKGFKRFFCWKKKVRSKKKVLKGLKGSAGKPAFIKWFCAGLVFLVFSIHSTNKEGLYMYKLKLLTKDAVILNICNS